MNSQDSAGSKAPLDKQSPKPSLLRHLAAITYDTLLVIPLVGVAVGILLAIYAAILGDPNNDAASLVNPHIIQAMASLCILGFFSVFWLNKGQTLGMQAWRIQLVSSSDKPITLRHTVLRCLAAALSMACFGLGYLWCLVDKNKRYWHDYLSGTELILLPKRDKKNKS